MFVARCQSLCHCGPGGVEETWGKEPRMLGSHLRGWESWPPPPPHPGHGNNGREILASATQRQFVTVAEVLGVICILTIPASWAGVPRSPLKQGTVIKIKYKFVSEWILAGSPCQSPWEAPDLADFAGTCFHDRLSSRAFPAPIYQPHRLQR